MISEHSLYKAMSFGDGLLGAYVSTPLASCVIFVQLLETQFPNLEIGDKINVLVELCRWRMKGCRKLHTQHVALPIAIELSVIASIVMVAVTAIVLQEPWTPLRRGCHPSVHPSIQQIFVEYRLCAKHCSGNLGVSSKQEK